METAPKYLIVEAGALPEVFPKVVRMKELLELGEAATVNEAAEAAGVSRSAFYKYKDAVRPFREMKGGQIVTFQFQLRNRPGVLSQLLNIFAQTGGNILTINQGLPVDSRAVATIAAETSGLKTGVEELLALAGAVEGVLSCQIIGE
ncbi:MAG: ACT domain-containing protein [Oscillospiraceae bacterium]|nr:ACT domain-containing protein [Oscillospiraceae bacterium]